MSCRKYENLPQFNADWLASLKTWYYFRLCFSSNFSGFDVTVIKPKSLILFTSKNCFQNKCFLILLTKKILVQKMVGGLVPPWPLPSPPPTVSTALYVSHSIPFLHICGFLYLPRNIAECIWLPFNSSFTHPLGLVIIRNKSQCICVTFNSYFTNFGGLKMMRNEFKCICIPFESFLTHLLRLILIKKIFYFMGKHLFYVTTQVLFKKLYSFIYKNKSRTYNTSSRWVTDNTE